MPGQIERDGDLLIPAGSGFHLYDLVINGTTYTPDWDTLGSLDFSVQSGIYDVRINAAGQVSVFWQTADEADNPPNGITRNLLTITSYRMATADSSVISTTFGPVDCKIIGQSVVTDTTPPTFTSMSPSGQNVDVGTTIVFTADEPITKGATGTITIWNRTAGSAAEIINIATAPSTGEGSVAVINGNQLAINPANYPANAQIDIRFTAGVVKDAANNPIAAETGSTWTFKTRPNVVVNPGTLSPDVIVSTRAAIMAQLADWEANWNSTVPAGKTNTDIRVLGYDTSWDGERSQPPSVAGGITFNGYQFPQRVYVRSVGAFTQTGNVPDASVRINGRVVVNNCTNLWLTLNYATALDESTNTQTGANTHDANYASFQFKNSTDCGAERNIGSGIPNPTLTGNNSNYYCFRADNCTNQTFRNNLSLYSADTDIKIFGASPGLVIEGNMARHTGGNDYVFSSDSVVSDLIMRYNFGDRKCHPSSSQHVDFMQYNNNAVSHRYTVTHNVSMHGVWTKSVAPSNAAQFWFSSAGGNTSTGPNTFNQNLIVTGQQRAVDTIPGGAQLTTMYNSMIMGIYTAPLQTGNAPYPRIINTHVYDYNFATIAQGDTASNCFEGPNGIRLQLTTGTFASLLAYHEAVPTEFNSLWDIRPKVGARTHPAYTPSNQRVGCYEFWEMLLAADPRVCLSKVGWPVAPVFIGDYDYNDNFWGGYTGDFDSNGNNI